MTDDLVKRLRSNRPIPTLPHEAADRIEALTAENERLLVSNEQWQVDYNEAVIDKLELETEIDRLRAALFESVALNENYYAVEEDDGYQFTEAPAVIAQARTALEKQP